MNFFNFFDLKLGKNFPYHNHLLDSFHDIFDLSIYQENSLPSLKLLYIKSFRVDCFNKRREILDGVFVDKTSILDSKYGVLIDISKDKNFSITMNTFCLEWIIWLFQLSLIGGGASFAHGAAIERDGEAILFPSWGGVGKTALVADFVKKRGWNLLGDDMSVVTSESILFGFPKPMVLYPYHKSIFPEIFSQGIGPASPAFLNNFWSWLAPKVKPVLRPIPSLLQFARNHNPQSVRIHPSKIFGKNKISPKAKLKTVVWLDRIKGLKKPEFIEAKRNLASRLIGSTLLEFDQRCICLTNVAMGLGLIDVKDYYIGMSEVLHKGLKESCQFILNIPDNEGIENIPNIIYQQIKNII